MKSYFDTLAFGTPLLVYQGEINPMYVALKLLPPFSNQALRVSRDRTSRRVTAPQQTKNLKDVMKDVIDLRSAFDAVFRGGIRYIETRSFSNSFLRVPYRLVTEILRNGLGVSLQKLVEKEKIGIEELATGVKRALENTFATIIFEPNKYANRLARMGIGLANMLVRFVARIGLVSLTVNKPESVEIKNIPDEFIARGLRFITSQSKNPFIGTFVRTLEQIIINVWLKLAPFKNHLLAKLVEEKPEVIPDAGEISLAVPLQATGS